MNRIGGGINLKLESFSAALACVSKTLAHRVLSVVGSFSTAIRKNGCEFGQAAENTYVRGRGF